jgi:hypothetical protein
MPKINQNQIQSVIQYFMKCGLCVFEVGAQKVNKLHVYQPVLRIHDWCK